jgi:osmoprotectant transport system ATP-binding protein
MIEIRDVSKYYPNQGRPAVDHLSMTLAEGEITILVGPSGCGKSTTIRLINGMIPATSGDIFIKGENVRDSDPNKLRMNIGYVIQQIGLLPHRTIAQNIAIVPKLHGWDAGRIKRRTLELLELMGLDPAETMHKYPLQLSGGQMQRVGVARAMAVDPAIMLMDEPFGAVDPITRRGLQDEFLRLQKVMKKTICFVTHDINEAIKMGDKIAIFNKGQLIQYDVPENILSSPANDFVRDFIGGDRMVKKLNLYTAGHVNYPLDKHIPVNEAQLPQARQIMGDSGHQILRYLDDQGQDAGFVTLDMLRALGPGYSVGQLLPQIELNRANAIQAEANLADAFSLMLENNTEYLAVYNGDTLIGSIAFRYIRAYINNQEEGE